MMKSGMRSVGATRWGVLLGTTALLAACEVPTGMPILESRWVVPTDGTEITVAEFLPANVGLGPAGSSFIVQPAPTSVARTLADLCSTCAALDGTVAPKPAFNGSIARSVALPDDVESAQLVSGSIVIRLTNGLNFDPIRPGGGTGSVTITIRNAAGRTLGSTVVSGASDSFAPGSTLTRTIGLTGGSITGLEFEAVVNSPLGTPVQISASSTISADLEVPSLVVSSAVVDLGQRPVEFTNRELDVEDIDSDIADKIDAGSLRVRLTNPIGVAAQMQVRITGPFEPITKTLAIGADPTSTTTVEFSGEELRRFIGKAGVNLSGSGTPTAAQVVTIEPADQIDLDLELDLTIRIGG